MPFDSSSKVYSNGKTCSLIFTSIQVGDSHVMLRISLILLEPTEARPYIHGIQINLHYTPPHWKERA